MELKETLESSKTHKTVLEDAEYFKYIFKKTEKIACAVFYILRSDSHISQTDSVVIDLEFASRTLINVSLESLKSGVANMEDTTRLLTHALVSLESKLRIAHAARIVSTDLLEVFVHEVDGVVRMLRRFKGEAPLNPLFREESREVSKVRAPLPKGEVRPARALPVNDGGMQGSESRRERVLKVIKEKGEATIKDIVEVIKDCSEKTIQRELISLIKDNMVSREGERRWSKYKLV